MNFGDSALGLRTKRSTSVTLCYLQLARQNCGVENYITSLGFFPNSHNGSRPNVRTARKAFSLSALENGRRKSIAYGLYSDGGVELSDLD